MSGAPSLHGLVAIETSGCVLAEVYATLWFLTLFAAQGGCQSLAALQRLWDAILIEDDHFLHYFVALALLRQNEDYLSQTPGKYLPMGLLFVFYSAISLSFFSFRSHAHLSASVACACMLILVSSTFRS